MIPKKIHYCWFGPKKKTELTEKCIESWKKHLPDYELILWNEDNYDVYTNAYTKEAYDAGKYAFVSDYARFDILYEHGGLYLDTDVEVLKSLDKFLQEEAFMGFEDEKNVAPGLIIGANKNNHMIKKILDSYEDKNFLLENGKYDLTTVVTYTTRLLLKHGLKQDNSLQKIEGMKIYPKTYFCPTTYNSNQEDFSENTHTIHHFSTSWLSEKDKKRAARNQKIEQILISLFGEKNLESILRFIKKIKK